MIVLVPWRLESAENVDLFRRASLPGDVRRGETLRPAMRRHKGGKNTVIEMQAKQDATPDDVLEP